MSEKPGPPVEAVKESVPESPVGEKSQEVDPGMEQLLAEAERENRNLEEGLSDLQTLLATVELFEDAAPIIEALENPAN